MRRLCFSPLSRDYVLQISIWVLVFHPAKYFYGYFFPLRLYVTEERFAHADRLCEALVILHFSEFFKLFNCLYKPCIWTHEVDGGTDKQYQLVFVVLIFRTAFAVSGKGKPLAVRYYRQSKDKDYRLVHLITSNGYELRLRMKERKKKRVKVKVLKNSIQVSIDVTDVFKQALREIRKES